MRISGLQKTTLLDYPGHIAATIFLGHCNLRCPFCHNMPMVLTPEIYREYSIVEIIDFLRSRVGKLDGVAITGGEPLLNEDIFDLLYPIKNLGYNIKVDTNGFFPNILKEIIDKNIVDMIAMDIKAGFSNYLKVCAINDSEFKKKITVSIDIIMNSKINYEFRTTCVKGLHSTNDFYEIREMINGAKKYFIQDFKKSPNMGDVLFLPFTREELEIFKDIVSKNVEFVDIRGI